MTNQVIYVVIKAAQQVEGESMFVTTEKAFKERIAAEAWCKALPVVWEEEIGNHGTFYCERGLHQIILE